MAKKTGSQKSGRKQTSSEKKLAAQLAEMLPDLDQEGLVFLIEQAHIHLYNMGLEKLQKNIQGDKTAAAEVVSKPGVFTIELSADQKTYHIALDGKWKMFNNAEMTRIVKIANGAPSEYEASAHVYNWMLNERRDMLHDFGISSVDDERWNGFFSLIKKSFTLQ